MLYEFAMTPDLFDASVIGADSSLGTILVTLLRGFADNCLLANLNKGGWSEHVQENRIETLLPSLKDKLITCLNILHDRHRLVRHPRRTAGDPVNDNEWLDLTLESHKRIAFHGIVLSQNLITASERIDPAFIELSGVLDSSQWLNRKRTLTLTKCERDYRASLAPILRHAKALSLVDPYFNAHESRYFDTVRICSELMGQRGHDRLRGRIYLHAELNNQKPDSKIPEDHLNYWNRKLRPLVDQHGHRFKIFLWEVRSGSEGMHDRFLLTDQCGISVPGGLDCRTRSTPNSTTWSLLDEDDRQKRFQDYDPAQSPFRLVGEREVS